MKRSPRALESVAWILLPVTPALAQIKLTDVTRECGVVFRHTDGGCGRHFFPEQLGSGVALFDRDGDGRIDLFLASGAPLPGCPDGDRRTSRLFQNAGGGKFADVTDAAGVGSPGQATGCAAGDFDNDGDADLFVSCFGPNRLFRNHGGRFVDVAKDAGVDDAGFGASAAFLDFDLDGDLDLHVVNYVELPVAHERQCKRAGVDVYCLPQDYPGQADKLYRNDGGKFVDVTKESGVFQPRARGLGVTVGDYDDDGDPDIYVANDTNENHLFENLRAGRFLERGLEAGVALGETGAMENGMGTDWGDFDSDGRLDLIVTNFDGQSNTLYRNLGGGFFSDVSFASGIGGPSLPYVGWAALFVDLDLDGLLDLFITNGHVFENVASFQEGSTHAQPCLVHQNLGGGKFSTTRLDASRGIASRVGRGAAAGDIDDDGDLDLVVNNLNGEPFVLRNDTPRAGAWLGLQLEGTKSNRSAIGARVTVRAGGLLLVREIKSGTGYLSQSDSRLVFGLGAAGKPDSITVRWPGGATQDVTGEAKTGTYTRIVER